MDRYGLRQRVACAAVLAVTATFLWTGAVGALETRTGDRVGVGSTETVADDLFAAGQAVTITGTVKGDAMAFGRTVVVTGTVEGDLLAAAEQVIVEGTVLGSVRAGASDVTISGAVGRNVTVGAARLELRPTARVAGNVIAGTANTSVLGSIGRGLTAGSAVVDIAGSVGGDVVASVETLTLSPGARIGGALKYRSQREASVPAGVVGGGVDYTYTPPSDSGPAEPAAPLLNGMVRTSALVWLAGTAVLGVLLLALFPEGADRVVGAARQLPLQSLGLGLALLVCVPVVAVLLAITLIGIPAMLALLATYGVGLLLAWPALALAAGASLAHLLRPSAAIRPVWLLLVGLVVLHGLTYVPWLGGFVAFLGLCLGLGLTVVAAGQSRTRNAGVQQA
ncbi:MAG: polymer-forming cytoskeletal protein [Chloroflexota bacterium]